MRRRPTTIMAQCCPARRAVDGIHCKLHLPRTLTVGVTMAEAPRRCPHCDAAWPAWHGDDLLRHCVPCGQLWERPMAVFG